eukprot:SAG31_NODE_4255_length_3414_cov_4.628959_4_plen_101_part_00
MLELPWSDHAVDVDAGTQGTIVRSTARLRRNATSKAPQSAPAALRMTMIVILSIIALAAKGGLVHGVMQPPTILAKLTMKQVGHGARTAAGKGATTSLLM